MLKTIVVPLDGSPLAERALSLATALSIPTAAHLVLVRVFAHDPPSVEATPLGTYLDKTAADLRDRGFDVDTVELIGDPVAKAIGHAAEQQQADLIVMTTHGRTGPARWLLGSVAEALVKCSPVPVLLHRAWDPGRRSILLGDQPGLLVTVDGSRFAEAALPATLSLADDLGAKVLLVRVDPRSPDVLQAEEDAAASMSGQAYQPLVATREYLNELADRLRAEWPSIAINTRVECGDPATAIVAAAEDVQAALVVMATHARTGVQRMTLGSVADRVLQHGRAPIVLVHPRHAELVDARRPQCKLCAGGRDPAENAPQGGAPLEQPSDAVDAVLEDAL
ncbi:MAG TPA: universal stress protein [Chloroflexota bacterium]|jgi:nucleotide-binding universal stress UspA family protein